MTKEDYIKRVLLIMNESGLMDLNQNSFIGADTAQVDRYIEGSYVDAWRRCATVMPRAWFRNDSFLKQPHYPDLLCGTGFVVLPDDFYLLTGFKMKGWTKAVYEAYIDNDKTAAIQSNENTRGSEIRPVCTISNRLVKKLVAIKLEFENETDNDKEEDDGKIKQVLNYYSLQKGLVKHEIEEAIYVPVCKPLIECKLEDELEIKPQVIEILAYLSASTVFTLFEKYDIAKALEQRAIEMFPGLKSIRGTNVTVKQ